MRDSLSSKKIATNPSVTQTQAERPCALPLSFKALLEVFLGRRPDFSQVKILVGGEAGAYVLACRVLMARGINWLKSFESNFAQTSDFKEFLNWLVSEKHKTSPEAALEFLENLFEGPRGDLIETGTEVWQALWSLQNISPETRFHLLKKAAIHPSLSDLLYLCLFPLEVWPAATLPKNELRYMIIADKGEMGARAVREAVNLHLRPVVVFSEEDDAQSLAVRLGTQNGGFTVGIPGGFRNAYANAAKIVDALKLEYEIQFGENWRENWSKSAIYPGYGPLAENSAAIFLFRSHGLTFVGPTHDVVERVGDKRFFRTLAQSIDPSIVTKGIQISATDSAASAKSLANVIRNHIGKSETQLRLPIRIKAANGGGGRGQAVVLNTDDLETATQRVLTEIQSNGWEPGLLLEENLNRTIHLEVQILRDRFGNTRHFGMRDCTEQRASQKIQEEAPPALLRDNEKLRTRMETLAVKLAHKANYFGAGTVELMFHEGRFYFLEMNTRIQVEHPVSEMTHHIQRDDNKLEPVNLVHWQMRLARGEAIDFEQTQIINTHVAREFRINAEAWRADLKDPRDGKKGLFLPNSGTFLKFNVPSVAEVREALNTKKIHGVTPSEIEDLKIRLDSGFEVGDSLVNKDPTFAKLIVSVRCPNRKNEYEMLRRICIYILERCQIEGHQVRPDGKPLVDQPFHNNLKAHLEILKHEIIENHCRPTVKKTESENSKRHVGWVAQSLRQEV